MAGSVLAIKETEALTSYFKKTDHGIGWRSRGNYLQISCQHLRYISSFNPMCSIEKEYSEIIFQEYGKEYMWLREYEWEVCSLNTPAPTERASAVHLGSIRERPQ